MSTPQYLISICRPHQVGGAYMIVPHVPGASVQYAKTHSEAVRIRDAMWNTPRETYMDFKVRNRSAALAAGVR